MVDYANASPTKRFFLDMLTRDISLEDSVLDLVDNCIDALTRSRDLDLTENLLNQRLVERAARKLRKEGLPSVDIQFSNTEFRISDRCGGIDYENARNDVFRFGRVLDAGHSRLSVYGIGLKRAIFKIGRQITVESRTAESGFRVKIDAEDWAEQEKWEFPIERLNAARSAQSAGTTIVVKQLNDDVRLRHTDGQLLASLADSIASAYALFLDRFVTIRLNGRRVSPKPIPLGLSKTVTPAKDYLNVGDVKITLLAGLAERVDEEWVADRAGWYVFCNGRVVVKHDKTDLTGWGVSGPQFVSKYRGFVGLAFFFAENPEALPWTTTKRGLNRESRAYLLARNKMTVLARPVLSFLNNMYPSGDPEEIPERKVVASVKATSITTALGSAKPVFSAVVSRPDAVSAFVTIQYKAKKRDVDAVRKQTKRASWSASRVGQYTFEYFLERECGK